MVWFKVDDHFHSNRKVKKSGLEAVGLWSVSGSYCAAHLTDGFVEEWFVKEWRRGPRLAAILVDVGLWYEATREGEKGWQFHDWENYQPTKKQVEAEREKARNRKAAQRLSQGESRRDSQGDDQGESRVESRETPVPYPPDLPARPSLIPVVDLGGELTQVGPDTPSKFCSKHPEGTERPCAACRRAREGHEAWESAQRDDELDQRRRLKEIADNCPVCQGTNWIPDTEPAVRCDHNAEKAANA